MEGDAPVDASMAFGDLTDAAKERGCEELVEVALDSKKALVHMLKSAAEVAKKDVSHTPLLVRS